MAVSSPGPLIAAPVRVPWWQLTGAHAQITCRMCHRGTIPADFERFADGTKCMSCHDHAKVHADADHPNGKFRDADCTKCHTR